MWHPVPSPHLAPFDGSFRVRDLSTVPPDGSPSNDEERSGLREAVEDISKLQHKLYADDRYALLLVFQAMDAAGKDSTIQRVLTGVNPAGCQVFSFKRPSAQELDHDFLWRSATRLPERGRIGVFNRSYYEEVLVVRVHPGFLDGQRLPRRPDDLWEERLESIREHEHHLARNGTVVLKFWLNVSREEQARRFVSRLEEPRKNWKFMVGDVEERAHWDAYMDAYEQAIAATSRPWAPWYAIPADDKGYMRLQVATIVRDALKALDLDYPEPEDDLVGRIDELKAKLKDGSL